MKVQRTLVLASVACLSVIAVAQSKYKTQQFVGQWGGSFQLVVSKLPKNATPDQINMAKKQLTKMTFAMSFKADGTFEAIVNLDKGKKETTTGKWMIKGSDLVTIDLKKNGKAVPKANQREDKLGIVSVTQQIIQLSPPDNSPILMIMKRK